jgi:hypothetical protein
VAALALVVTLVFGILPNRLVDQVSFSSQWIHGRSAVAHNAAPK